MLFSQLNYNRFLPLLHFLFGTYYPTCIVVLQTGNIFFKKGIDKDVQLMYNDFCVPKGRVRRGVEQFGSSSGS